MRIRTLIGLMICTLIPLSTPTFAQSNAAQPVPQIEQAQKDFTIPQGTTREFDASKGDIVFNGVLTNKGTMIIRSSNPAQVDAVLRAAQVVNEGRIVSEISTLTIKAESVSGPGEIIAPTDIRVDSTSKDLYIVGGFYRSEWTRFSTEGKLHIHAQRIDAKVDVRGFELSIGVREGSLNIANQKLDGDPLIYNTGGDVTTTVPATNGEDLYILASGNVSVGALDASGGTSLNPGRINIVAGAKFKNPAAGEVIFGCGNDCPQAIRNLEAAGPLESADGTYEVDGTIEITGNVRGKSVSMFARNIIVNGNIQADGGWNDSGPSVSLFAYNGISVTGTIKTNPNAVEPDYGSVSLQAPNVTIGGKITSDSVYVATIESSQATTGILQTAAIEARTSITFNAGQITFEEIGSGGGSARVSSLLPHASTEYSIKTGKLTARRYVKLAATGNINAGEIELLPNEANVPLGTHDVRIHANVGKETEATPLKIGGGTNGAASITVRGTTDLGEGLTEKTGVIFLTNGPSGDIVLDGAKIIVTNEHNGTPSLIAYAGTGQVTVKGTISLDGTATAPAGSILLVGDEIRSTGATLSAKDTLAMPAEKPAKIVLATSKLTLAGNLTVEANSKALTSVRIVPKGSITLDPQEHFDGLYVYVDKFQVNLTEEEILVGGSANLIIRAKSDNAKVDISAKPLKFNNGISDIFATGTGSQINVDYPGSPTGQNSLNFNGGAVTFNANNPDGDAGQINIFADKIRNAADAVVSLKANAESTGTGGNITISLDRGTLALGSQAGAMSLFATSDGGDGGTVTIINDVHNGRITYQNQSFDHAIDVSALGANGKGGTIDLKSDTLTDDGTVAVVAFADPSDVFVADGVGNGKGGKISLKHKHVNFAGRVNVSSGASDEGGEIEIVATNTIVLGTSDTKAEFFADAVGNGAGGNVEITPPDGATVNLSNTKISAKGAGNGIGGKVSISSATGNPSIQDGILDVYELINVDGGPLLNSNDFDGSISLNGILCQQWKIGSGWPETYWDCANPEAQRGSVPKNVILPELANTLVASLKGQLGNSNSDTVRLYVFESEAKGNTYFHVEVPGSEPGFAAGFTFRSPSNKNIYVGAFLKVGLSVRTEKQIGEASAHEIGHAIDITANYPSAPALNPTYDTYVRNDFLYLDYISIGATEATSVRRHPCQLEILGSTVVSGPFLGLINPATGLPYCDSSFEVEPAYSTLTNSNILQLTSALTATFQFYPANSSQSYPGGWAEIHSQAYAYRSYNVLNGVSPDESNLRLTNGIFNNGMFVCSQTWAIEEDAGNTPPPATTPTSGPAQSSRACNQALPGWYIPGQ